MIFCVVGASRGALDSPRVVSELIRAGHKVEVNLSEKARLFVGPSAFLPVASLVEEPTERPEAVVYLPATSGTLARLARGLEAGGPRTFVVPDLDDGATAEHPAVRENVALIERDGARMVWGSGDGMAPSREVVAVVLGGLGGGLSGVRVLVTAGGTREPIDSVRFIGNRSSGKMGLAIAREAARRGASVRVVAANIESREPGVGWVAVESVEEMRREVMEGIRDADALIMAAAVSDFTPAEVVGEKIRRGASERMTLELVATSDILGGVRERNPALFVIGFAATHGDPVPDAREKLEKKGADLIVGNDISRSGIGFGTEDNEVYIVGRDGETFVPKASKGEIARAVLDAMVDETKKERRN